MKAPQSPRRSCVVAAFAMIGVAGGIVGHFPVCAESGSVDGNYQPVFTSSTAGSYPVAICSSADGGAVVSGWFNIVNSRLTGSVTRLGSDGRLDADFQVPVTPWTSSATAKALPDGRLLIAANHLFSVTSGGVPDGVVAYSYCVPGTCGRLAMVAVQQDGSVFAIGSGLPLGTGTSPVVRFFPNGAVDRTYRPRLESAQLVTAAIADDSGRLVLVGAFQVAGEARVRHLLRLTPKGALDSTFVPVEPFGCESPNHWTATTARLAIQPDGRIVIAASWQDCALRSYSGVYRLLENGAMDPEFIPASPIENPSALALQADGGILVAGTVGVPCETQRSLLRRLHPDGRLDTGFNPEFAHAVPCRHGVLAILAETGRIWVVGDFDRVNGLPSSGLAWLNPDGSSPAQPDLRFESVARVDFAGSDSHGAVFVSGRSFDAVNGINRRSFAKLHASGSLDPSFEVTDSRWLSLAARSALPLLPTGGPEVLMMSSNRPAARLLASGAVDPAFALPRDLAGLYSEWQTQMDSRDRLVCTTVSNRILRAFRLMPNGSWDAGYTPFTREPVSSWSVAGHLTALDSTDRLLVAGAVVSNTFGGILRLRPDGGLDPSFGPPPLPLGGVVGLALGSDGAPVVMAGIPSRPVWLTTDGRRLEGANSLPPLPGGSMASNVLRGFTMDARDRLYLILQSDLANFVAYRFTAGRDWDRSFVVTGRGSYANATLSKDGDWLYITGAMEANGMRSGGLVRVSTLETPRIEIIGSSPFFGTELRLTGEPGRRHRVETSGDLRTWQAFVDLTLGEQPEWLTDWIGWGEPQRFYRLLFVADPSRAEAAAAGP